MRFLSRCDRVSLKLGKCTDPQGVEWPALIIRRNNFWGRMKFRITMRLTERTRTEEENAWKSVMRDFQYDEYCEQGMELIAKFYAEKE